MSKYTFLIYTYFFSDTSSSVLNTQVQNPDYSRSIVDFLSELGWYYVSVVQSSDSASTKDAQAFFTHLQEDENSICTATHQVK